MRRNILSILLIGIIIVSLSSCSIYDQYMSEARKIAKAMTLEQKIGQTIQITFEGITVKNVTDPSFVEKFQLGSLLVGGNDAPTDDGNVAKLHDYLEEDKNKQIFLNATVQNWKKLADKFKNVGVTVNVDKTKYLVKLLLGTDAVHGDQHSVGNVIFPHNIGLSCSHNAANFENVGFWTKEGMKKTGFNFAFAPCVAVTHNPQWGRTYETMGQEDNFIEEYAKAFTRGLQDISGNKINGVLGSVKHFMGDGATRYGANEGTATVNNFRNFVEHNVRGYRGAIQADIGNVMVSYSAINLVPNSLNSAFLMGVLRGEENFTGFTISDYDDVVRTAEMSLPRTLINVTEADGYALMMNAGVDMLMISSHQNIFGSLVERLIKEGKKNVEKGHVLEQRLEEAVTRILAVKLAMGLVTTQNSEEEVAEPVHETVFPASSSQNEYIDSLTAAQESLVVLKNTNNVLPAKALTSDIKYVVLVGEDIININRLTRIELFRNFDNIGMQCGGWTVRWQGYEGNDFWKDQNKASSNASSILDALTALQKKNNFTILYPNYSTFTNEVQIQTERRQFISKLTSLKKELNSRNTLIIGAFGEVPYAESEGDTNIPYCHNEDLSKFCLYSPWLNPYVTGSQRKDLTVDFSKFDQEVISEVRAADQGIPLISVLFTGRPVPIANIYEKSTSVIAAWLPGTSGGQAVVNLITGEYIARANGSSDRKNTLSMDWPRNMKSLEDFPIYQADGIVPRIIDAQFEVGYGLSTGSNNVQLKSE